MAVEAARYPHGGLEVILRFELRPFPYLSSEGAYLVSRCTAIEGRIVSVEVTKLQSAGASLLALPAHPEFVMVGDTGVWSTAVTSWPIRVERRQVWLARTAR